MNKNETKKEFNLPKIEVIDVEDDIIATSPTPLDPESTENELPFVPKV